MELAFADRVALVTGVSRGIGRAIALHLARQGAHVVGLARNQALLDDVNAQITAEGGAATLIACEMTEPGTIESVAHMIQMRWGRLDVLISNAGVLGPLQRLATLSLADWESVVAINLTTSFRLIQSCDALLRAAPAGRAIFITSGAASNEPYGAERGPYQTTKAALNGLARSYAADTADSRVVVTIVNPGPLRTDMRAQSRPLEDPLGLPPPEQAFVPEMLKFCLPDWTDTGRYYDFPVNKVLRFRTPG
jgi:NAD(P)-dependent dehydrogenase (short-subunit alcohol dehydrogenase family)